MKLPFSVILFAIVGLFACKKEDGSTIHLPITYKDGYGPFMPNWARLENQSSHDSLGNGWGKIFLPIKGVPKGWSHMKKEMIWMDTYQLIYQNYLKGTIKESFYKNFQSAYEWTPDPNKLSESPIKCYVYVVWGVDPEGNWAALVDADNDLDFSDEVTIYPEVLNVKHERDFRSYKRSTIVSFQAFQKGHVVDLKIPIVIKLLNGEFVYNFPRYAVASLTHKIQSIRSYLQQVILPVHPLNQQVLSLETLLRLWLIGMI